MSKYEVYSILTLDVSTTIEADNEDIAIQQVNRLLDKVGLRRDTLQMNIFGAKVELEIHNSTVSVEEAYCEGDIA